MNNKGFMMAEVVVVASLVLIALVGFYTSYNKILSIYNQRVDYYDVATVYELGNIRDNYLNELTINDKKTILGDVIYYVDKDNIKNKEIDTDEINPTFVDYIEYLYTSLDADILTNESVTGILIMENCNGNANCKYAYLEVFNNETSE